MASAIATDFSKVWWEDDAYVDSREEFPDPETVESPLKIEIGRYLTESLSEIPTSGALNDELELLRSAVIEGIITTNYDGLLETVFPLYKIGRASCRERV